MGPRGEAMARVFHFMEEWKRFLSLPAWGLGEPPWEFPSQFP